ncbi:MAG TPA: hypothetical protein VHT26_11285 [Trebonia sp.]|nr:hypothetical protein [Trebonia sp.]
MLNRKRVRWTILPVLFAMVAALLATEMPADASTDVLTEGYTVHSCKVIGSADGYQAVVCSDILTGFADANDYYAKGQIEVYCQTDSGTAVQCANIYAEGVFADAGGDRLDSGSYACGHAYGACPSSRVVISEGQVDYPTNTQCDDDSYSNVWTVVYGGNTQIELPKSDDTIELDASNGNDGINYSSGHYLVCL